jgi:hypothetical protein
VNAVRTKCVSAVQSMMCRGWFIFACVSCTSVETVDLGRASPPFGPFDKPHLVSEICTQGINTNPSLTSDLLEIYFTSDRPGGLGQGDIWVAQRATPTGVFDTPSLVSTINSANSETSPAISGDGLTLWFSSDRAGTLGGFDIWISTRADRQSAWTTPINVPELNTASDEIPRPVGDHGLQMPLANDNANKSYQNYMTSRTSLTSPWSKPQIISELLRPNASTVDGFLTDDGLMLIFNVEPTTVRNSDLYRAWRYGPTESFSSPVPLTDINTTFMERDPWLSPQGDQFFFSSDRDGAFNIYEANAI